MLTALALALVPATITAPLDFHCASPLGHSGQVRQILAGPTYRVSGEFSPVRLEEIPDPALPVRIQDNDIPSNTRGADVTLDSEAVPGRYVLLGIAPRYRGEGREDIAVVYVQFRNYPEGEEEIRNLGTISTRSLPSEPLPFVIEAHADRVTIEAGGHRTEVAMRLERGASLNLSCIGGDFSFTGMAWGDLPGASAGP